MKGESKRDYEERVTAWNRAMYAWEVGGGREKEQEEQRHQQRFEKYKSSETRDTGTPQTDLYFGTKGSQIYGHIAVSGNSGEILSVRDDDGEELYDHNKDGPYTGQHRA